MRSAIKDLDDYDHRVYTGDEPFPISRRGTNTFIDLADDFYIRVATSSPNCWRIVLPRLGITRVFTVHTKEAIEIMELSSEYSVEDEQENVLDRSVVS